MKNTEQTYFVTFTQNNSGGYFISNEEVDQFVIIEGKCFDDIINKARTIFNNYREYCECCGERWDDDYKYFDDLNTEPLVYGKSVYKYNSLWGGKAIIYRLDGTKEFVKL